MPAAYARPYLARHRAKTITIAALIARAVASLATLVVKLGCGT
jgi:hypothetical protein